MFTSLKMKYRHHFPKHMWEYWENLYEDLTGVAGRGAAIVWDKNSPQSYGVVVNAPNDTGQYPDQHGIIWLTTDAHPLDIVEPDEGPIAA